MNPHYNFNKKTKENTREEEKDIILEKIKPTKIKDNNYMIGFVEIGEDDRIGIGFEIIKNEKEAWSKWNKNKEEYKNIINKYYKGE